MLDPKRPIALLPQDREIMDITGMSEAQYRWFVRQAIFNSKLRPGEPTADFGISLAVSLVVGLALTAVSALLAPKPPQQKAPKEQRRIGGQEFVSGQRFAPTSGFDSVQNVVELGSTIPLVYANRRKVDNRTYGGVRVNTNLLWSQLFSIGSGQFLRAIFLVSEGTVPEPDPQQFAIGNNLLNTFDLQDASDNSTSRLTLYYVDGSQSSNRIVQNDYMAGRSPALDLGNAQANGASDVYQARADGDLYRPDFVYASTPSNQTTFGVSSFIGNNFPYRTNPQIKPTVNQEGPGRDTNDQAEAEREKDKQRYYGRAAATRVTRSNGSIINTETNIDLNVGDKITYRIFSFSDYDGFFEFGNSRADTKDIAQAVASRQNSYDDAILLGERYLTGTAIAVCVDRTPEAFSSEVTNKPVQGGQDVEAVFEVVSPGRFRIYGEDKDNVNPDLDNDEPKKLQEEITATNKPHILRCSEGSVTLERKSKFVEIGLRSTVNLNFSGVCAWRNIPYDYGKINTLNGEDASYYTNPTYTAPETRYSCFKVAYREANTTNYTEINRIFAVRSLSSSPVYNYLRLEFPNESFWEIKFTPVSGFEARQDGVDPANVAPFSVLDSKLNNRERIASDGIILRFSGVADLNVNNSATKDLLSVQILGEGEGSDELNGFDDEDFHVDRYARLAESFIINEMTSSASNPEHQIVYLNTQTTNSRFNPPNYANLAMVGLNIRSSTEINQLQQFSVYCEQGINSTNRFPDVLFDLLTNKRYGTGRILNSEQIDTASFDAAADFCESRLYFFDGVIEEKLNIRSWAAETAQAFLLDFVVRNGKFALQPAVNLPPLGGDELAETIDGLYTAGNIIEDSFTFSSVDEQERIPPRVQVRWRDEKSDQDKGNFAIIRQVTVKENTTPDDAPLEQVDATAFATSQQQAIDIAKFICRSKRLVTHTIGFSTTPPESSLDIGSVFKLGLETVNYNQPQNGAIASTGEVTAWPPLSDGSYSVLLWDGTDLQETTITVSGGKSSPAGSIFCLQNTTPRAGTYKTQSLSFDEDGNILVEATFFPTDDSGISLIAKGFDEQSNWTIEGEI